MSRALRFLLALVKGLTPWDPTPRLVIVGLYRYVRNPMIGGVILVLLGVAYKRYKMYVPRRRPRIQPWEEVDEDCKSRS